MENTLTPTIYRFSAAFFTAFLLFTTTLYAQDRARDLGLPMEGKPVS